MNIEKLIVDFFNNIGSFPFDTILKIIAVAYIVFWIMVSGWVFLDARERSQSRGFQFLSFIFVLIFNIPGLFIYMLIRPKATVQEQYWGDLEKRYLLYETAELFDCPKCGYPLQPGFINCPNCAETIKIKCECGVNIDKYWKHCPYCGRGNSKANILPTTVPNTEPLSVNRSPNVTVPKTEVQSQTPIVPTDTNVKDIGAQKEEVRTENRMKVSSGLNSVFKQSQIKLVQLKEKMFARKVENKAVVKESKNIKNKKKNKAKTKKR